ncbi:MAG: dsRBD fold-containing protein [Actinomycetota bacterium]
MDYVVNLHVDVDDRAALATASLECPSGSFKAEGHAKIGRTDIKGHVAGDLATARALRSIEAQLMEHVHEHIDRCTDTA